MKKTLRILLAFMLVAVMIFAVACNNSTDTDSGTTPPDGTPPTPPEGDGGFVNPGDNLGGGGTGEIPDESDKTDDVSGNVTTDMSDLAADADMSQATAIAATTEHVTISQSGSYVLSGEYSGGVEITSKLNVHLFLNNATISSTESAGLATGKKCTVTITAVDSTTNSISTSASDTNALHVKGSLNVNGNGTLRVTSAGKNGVKVSGAMQIVNAKLTVSAANHAIACASFAAVDATVTVTAAGKDGINADCDYDNSDGVTNYEYTTEQGFVTLVNSSYTATVSGDGIQAETFAYLEGSNLSVTTNGEFVAYSEANMETYGLTADDFRYVKSGSSYQKVADDYRGNGTKYALVQSCKGVKVGEIKYEVEDSDGNVTEYTVASDKYSLVVDGGEININSTDDALHVNSGNLFVESGDITVTTLDDGLTCDLLLRVNGGNITVLGSYEGLEGAYVEIADGNINVKSSDDGINAASDDTSIVEHIIVKGGTIVVDADGDGFDSNGSILFAGGTVTVYGPTSGADAGLDADRGIVVTGGTLVATSTLGMVETPSTNSTQYVVSYANSTTLAAGTELSIVDSDGNVVVSTTLQKACQSVIVSSGSFVNGGTYKVMSGDTQLAEFTISSIITTVGSSGNGGPGGGGFGPGGQGGQGGRPGGRN